MEEVCSDLLSHCRADGESFLPRIINGNETWIHHFGLQTKGQSMDWHYRTYALKKEFKATISPEKVMPTFLVAIMRGQTTILRSVVQILKALQKCFRRAEPHKNVAEIPPSTQPHTSLKKEKASKKLGWTVNPHPPHGLNLTPSNFHFFGTLKAPMEKGLRVMMRLMKKWLQVQNSNCYRKTIDTRFSLAQSCWSGWRLCRKTWVTHPSSYPTSMFKELYT